MSSIADGMTSTLTYKKHFLDGTLSSLFCGFKQFLQQSEQQAAAICAKTLLPSLSSNALRILDVGAGDGAVSLAFLQTLLQSARISVLQYVAIDVAPDLVTAFLRLTPGFTELRVNPKAHCADATSFCPADSPDLIVAFNSWYGVPFEEIQRYRTMLAPKGILAITLSSRSSITTDLTTHFVEPVVVSEDLEDYLISVGLSYRKQRIYSQILTKHNYVKEGMLVAHAKPLFRYLLRRPTGMLHDIVPYLESKSENYFQVPQDLFVISA